MAGPTANTRNVDFAFDTALRAARDLHALANVVDGKQDARATEGTLAQDGWEGGHVETFRTRMSAEGRDAGTVKGALVTLAKRFASEWAAARGEQDRINFARYVQEQKEGDSWVEDGAELIVGEDDYGEPPADPPIPTYEHGYQPTREPMYDEYEGSGTSSLV